MTWLMRKRGETRGPRSQKGAMGHVLAWPGWGSLFAGTSPARVALPA